MFTVFILEEKHFRIAFEYLERYFGEPPTESQVIFFAEAVVEVVCKKHDFKTGEEMLLWMISIEDEET